MFNILKKNKVLLGIDLLFVIVIVIKLVVAIFLKDIRFNIDLILPFPVILIVIGIFGLFNYVILMIYNRGKHLKILLSVMAFSGFIVLSVLAMLSTESKDMIKQDGYTVYISEFRFLFGGSDTLYLKDNFLISHKIGVASQGEDATSTYGINDDKLIITTYYGQTSEVYQIDLND